ncbi:MAG: diguanylate cyclase [Candidatus Omnitrophica bacterium]|nr:diguanylate cyclase [Candidatus Omnitrophota bacterium]MDD5487742.1 diguanylate cyclase [Candidatus Omnitrophota bacterium]
MGEIAAWMVKSVATVSPGTSIGEVCALMKEKDIGAVVIEENGRPTGIFTERDVVKRVVVGGIDADTTPVGDVMTRDIITVNIGAGHKEAYDLMMRHTVRHVPVVEDDGMLAGIVSMRDVLRYNMRIMEYKIEELTKEVQFVNGMLDETNDSRNKKLQIENSRLEKLVMVDALTGLYNYRYFDTVFANEVARAGRYSRPLTVLFIDIDHFKQYNDINGHDLGNIVLKQVADILRATSRGSDETFKSDGIDIVARYGGEEFVIVLPETERMGGMARARRILRDVRNYDFYNKESQPLGRLTVSIGVAEFPRDASGWQELIRKADSSLYKAKSAGRDRVM